MTTMAPQRKAPINNQTFGDPSQWQSQLDYLRSIEQANASRMNAFQAAIKSWQSNKNAADSARSSAVSALEGQRSTLAQELARRQGAYQNDMDYMRMAAANNKDRTLQGQLDSPRGYQDSPYWQAMMQTTNQINSINAQQSALPYFNSQAPNLSDYGIEQMPGGLANSPAYLQNMLLQSQNEQRGYANDMQNYINWAQNNRQPIGRDPRGLPIYPPPSGPAPGSTTRTPGGGTLSPATQPWNTLPLQFTSR